MPVDPSNNIQGFVNAFAGGGVRTNLFKVTGNIPGYSNNRAISFLCKAAQIPASTLGVIEVPYFGRKIKIAGDRTFAEWSTTIINDEDFQIRNALEEWINTIQSPESNLRELASASPLLYKSQATVTQFGKTGDVLRVYQFNGIYPQTVAPIDLSWETVDAIEEFTCTWQYDSFEVIAGTTGIPGPV
jgi:hypothetical protein